MMKDLVDRFIRYAKVDTRSDDKSDSCPSSSRQLLLAKMLQSELSEMGLEDVNLDPNGYISATLRSNIPRELPVIGLIAHMDTSPDMTGEGVNPRITRGYDGNGIVLAGKENIVLSPDEFPELNDYIGQDIITTDGTTLLGADDKSGIAEIITAVEHFILNPGIPHGTVKIGFTPDEEIGRGADRFDVKAFGADFAYTVDGGAIGELEYENFNAALATITILGRNVHPGTAKNQMINSIHLADEFLGLLPEKERPEHTEKYEGFFHLVDINGTVEETTLRMLVRDHDPKGFDARKELLEKNVALLQKKYGTQRILLEIKEQYRNMKEKIEPHLHIIELAREAMIKAGVRPVIKPIRGGTDGARLSFMGLPCPNIFTGGHNFHGRYEYIPVNSMEAAVRTIINIIGAIPEKY